MRKINSVGQYVEIEGQWFRIKGGELVQVECDPSKEAIIGYVSKADGVELEEGELESILNDGIIIETNRPDKGLLYVSEVRGEIGILWLNERFGGEERAYYFSFSELVSLKKNIDNENILKALKVLYSLDYVKSGDWENEVIEFKGKYYRLGYKFSGERVFTSIKQLKIKESQENVKGEMKLSDKIYSRMKAIDL